MRVVDENMETLHIYVVREDMQRPSLLPLVLSGLALSVLLVLCVFSSYRQPEIPVTLRVPAVFLPVQTFSTTVAILPTGKKTYPATCARGRLTITNGTVISQTIPAGFTFVGVATDAAVFVPAGSANGYGVTSIEAHALTCGKSGNFPAYTLNYTLGAGVYIRNLAAFHGGQDAYTVPVQLPKDRQTALDQARTNLAKSVQNKALLASPCREVMSGVEKVVVQWTCRYFTYRVSPFIHVAHIHLSGKLVSVDGFIVVRPRPFTGK